MIVKNNQIISGFLAGINTDTHGRYFSSILLWDDEQLEECHDQIQWTFPLHEESKFANFYPIIDPEFIQETKENEMLWIMIQNNMKLMTARMANFYGFNLPPLEGKDFYNKRTDWIQCDPPDHNLLRITRIIRSLRLFELEPLAYAFYGGAINKVLTFESSTEEEEKWEKTFSFWEKALNNHPWETLR